MQNINNGEMLYPEMGDMPYNDLPVLENREPEERRSIYVVNLDNIRIFLLIGIFTIILGLSFLFGFLFGRGTAMENRYLASERGVVVYDDVAEKSENLSDKDPVIDLAQKTGDETINDAFLTGDNEKVETEVIDKGQQNFNDRYYRILQNESGNSSKNSTKKKTVDTLAKEKRTSPNKKETVTKKDSTKLNSSKPGIVELKDINSVDSRLSVNSPFAIQIGSFSDYDNALRVRDILTSKNFPAYIYTISVKSSKYYRVRVGPAKSRAELYRALEEIKQYLSLERAVIVRYIS